MQGARTVLVITKGFRDLLQIGTQSRPNIFDLKIQKPEQLFEAVVEASERVHVLSRELRAQPDPGFFGPNVPVERGVTGEEVRVLVPLDHDQVRRELTEHWVRGIRSVAVILLHSYDSAPLFVPPRITSRGPAAVLPWPLHRLAHCSAALPCVHFARCLLTRSCCRRRNEGWMRKRRGFTGTRSCSTSRRSRRSPRRSATTTSPSHPRSGHGSPQFRPHGAAKCNDAATGHNVWQQVMPMVKAVPRGFTVTADAYLTPHIRDYVSAFSAGFDARLKERAVLFMQSDGGLTSVDNFMGSRAILSGPAGGVVGYARTTYDASARQPVIGFDMGGTSTDVSRCGGRPERCNRRATLQLVRVALGCSRVVRRCSRVVRRCSRVVRRRLQVWRPSGARLRERDCGRDHPGTTARYQHGRSRWRLAPVL